MTDVLGSSHWLVWSERIIVQLPSQVRTPFDKKDGAPHQYQRISESQLNYHVENEKFKHQNHFNNCKIRNINIIKPCHF